MKTVKTVKRKNSLLNEREKDHEGTYICHNQLELKRRQKRGAERPSTKDRTKQKLQERVRQRVNNM